MSSSTDDAGAGGRIAVGRVGKPHGLDGEVTLLPDTDDPGRFAAGSEFVTDSGRVLVVADSKPYRDKGLVVRFEGVGGRRDAELLRGLVLMVDPAIRRPLDQDEFWPDDLAGLEAVSPDDDVLGTVDRVEFGPGQNRLIIITSAGAEVQVPFVSAIVGDPVDGRIVIDAPAGLFPDHG